MIEKHRYESLVQLGICYDLSKSKEALLNYFKNPNNATPVYEFHPEDSLDNLWGYNSEGVSVHIQTRDTGEEFPSDVFGDLNFIDIKLVSEITPTQDLEDKVRSLADEFKK